MLKVRTGYSFKSAVGYIPDAMDVLVKLRDDMLRDEGGRELYGLSPAQINSMYQYAPIADRNNAYSWIKWADCAKEKDMTPVIGIEIAVVRNENDSVASFTRRPIVDYWTFYSKTDSLEPLSNLFSLATEQFYYQPLLSYRQALTAKGVIKVMGRLTHFPTFAKYWHDAEMDIDSGSVFFGVNPLTPYGLYRRMHDDEVEMVIIGDNYYPTPNDINFYHIICGRLASTRTYPGHIIGSLDIADNLPPFVYPDEIGHMLDNTNLIMSICCEAQPTKARLPAHTYTQSLRYLCQNGAEKLRVDLADPVYSERLTKELDIIKEKDFEDYFYIVYDLVTWAKERMVVGPARGSSCGSLVCYLLGITMIDPIPHQLIFERFIDLNRADLPDVDIDFPDTLRDSVIEYLQTKYGSDRSSKLGTVVSYRPKSALGLVFDAIDIPKYEYYKLSDVILKRSSGDSRFSWVLQDVFASTVPGKDIIGKYPDAILASEVEGHPSHTGQHASAVVINDQPLHRIAPIDRKKNVLQIDKKDAESINLLKVDVLGLTQLSIIDDVLKDNLGMTIYDLYEQTRSLDDPVCWEILNARKYSGLFQFNGLAVRSVAQTIPINCFGDIVIITAMARPGPLASGNAMEWILRRTGDSEVAYSHPLFEPYLKETLGVVAFQEQVMSICRDIGGMEWWEVSAIRKAMSGSYGVEYFNQYGEKFRQGATDRGMPIEVAGKMWDDLCQYGSWSFNKSHAVAYSFITYWCCWLKAYHGFEFAAATLNHEDDSFKQREILREMHKEGYRYKPVDSSHSIGKWIPFRNGDLGDVGSVNDVNADSNILLGPLTSITGIGPKTANNILGARKRGNKPTPTIRKKLQEAVTPLDSLYPITDAYKAIVDKEGLSIPKGITTIDSLRPESAGTEVFVVATISVLQHRNVNEAIIVAKRGYEDKSSLQPYYLNLRLTDDTSTINARVSRQRYDRLSPDIINRGRLNKAIYLFDCSVTSLGLFVYMYINNYLYIGDMEYGA